MQSVDTLIDLPKAWLLRLSTHLAPVAAARLRGTCRLLQKVIDATWEPLEVPIPPHRRSVPLTYEQVKAQLPPHKPWKPEWLQASEDLKAARAAGQVPGEHALVEWFAAETAATFDPLIAAANATKAAAPAPAGPDAASSSAAGTAAAGHPASSSSIRGAPFPTELDLYMAEKMHNRPWPPKPIQPWQPSADGFDPSRIDSRGMQLLAEAFRGLLEKGNSNSSSGPQAVSVGDMIRGMLMLDKPQDSSREVGLRELADTIGYISRWGDESTTDEEADNARKRVDGCESYWKKVFGPALTRLTANQACNLLKGKSMLCWLGQFHSELCVYSTATERLQTIQQVTFQGPSRGRGGPQIPWPPSAKTQPVAGEGTSSEQGGAERDSSMIEDDGSWRVPGRGKRGWGDGRDYDFHLLGETCTPSPLREQLAQCRWSPVHDEPNDMWVTADSGGLLVTTDSSCLDATAAEVQEFVSSDAASDGDRFDIYLSFGRDNADLYVFLAPVEFRFTGQLRAGTAEAGPAASASAAAAAAAAAAADGAAGKAKGGVRAARTGVPAGLGRGL